MSELAFLTPVVATGVYTATAYGQHGLYGWYFTETGGSSSITVTIRKNGDSTGTILEQLTLSASSSVGEDYATPISTQNVYVSITGSGTCQGGVRLR